jgi:uncharacterized protein YuzE
MPARLSYDPSADTARLRLSDHAVVDSEEGSPDILLDFDEDGRLVGLEILQASRRLPEDALASATRIIL